MTAARWAFVGYVLMTAGAVVAFLYIRGVGETIVAPTARLIPSVDVASTQNPAPFVAILVALTAVIVTGQLLARLFAYIGQPPVIGEVVAGILLGPSLLGPEISGWILPPSAAPTLGVIAQLGVVLYMFLVGMELDSSLLRRRPQAVVATSHASIVVPFLLGAVLSLYLYPVLSSRDVPFTSFALFMGAAMSVTAFPVLARILTDHRMSRTPLGAIALSCAAIDDVTAWCLLAFIVGVAKAEGGQGLSVTVLAIGYVSIMAFVVRPAAVRIAKRWEAAPLSRTQAAIVFVALLASALAAEAIGIHAIFGAFLFGAIIPHDSPIAKTLSQQLEHMTVLLLPAFFAFTGMRTRIDLLSGPDQWLWCGLIVLAATLGKFGGAMTAARLTGLTWRDAAALGALMNTRGLMELIVLNVGLELGIIAPAVFAMMVVMALATTMAAAPTLRWLRPETEPAA